jgi:ribulose-5-phosphate 4-epimerase/fuculose-1-phosphate aldolase
MRISNTKLAKEPAIDFREQRIDLACAFRWSARLNLHEAVANHFSLAVSDDGTRFLMNPNQRHFSLIRASDLLLLDANDGDTMHRANAPDATAWGLHGAIHRHCPHARCIMHAHPIHATVLACLANSTLPPIDQNTATFFGRYVIDEHYGGLAFEAEGERCARLLSDPSIGIMIMGNHGVMAIGNSVAETFDRLYYFERAAETYVKALWTGQPLRVMSDALAEQVARELEDYPSPGQRHFSDLKELLDRTEPDYRD